MKLIPSEVDALEGQRVPETDRQRSIQLVTAQVQESQRGEVSPEIGYSPGERVSIEIEVVQSCETRQKIRYASSQTHAGHSQVRERS